MAFSERNTCQDGTDFVAHMSTHMSPHMSQSTLSLVFGILPQDLLLSPDKEFAELLSLMVLEGGLPSDTASNTTDTPSSPATPVTSLAANAAANPTLAGTVITPAPVLTPATTAAAPALAAATAIILTATVVTHTGGKPIKVEAAAPPTFSRVDDDTDIEDWLEQVRENCVFGQVDQSQWVVNASGFLGNEPKSQWLARKRESRLTGNATELSFLVPQDFCYSEPYSDGLSQFAEPQANFYCCYVRLKVQKVQQGQAHDLEGVS